MNPLLLKGVLAGTVILTLALPGWAAEAKKAAPAKEEKAEKKMPAAKANEETKKLQEALKAKGQDPGPIDGVMGSKTQGALKAFQEASGIKATGRMDKETGEKLGVEMAKSPAKAMKKKEEK